jgi:hypothetical protein
MAKPLNGPHFFSGYSYVYITMLSWPLGPSNANNANNANNASNANNANNASNVSNIPCILFPHSALRPSSSTSSPN